MSTLPTTTACYQHRIAELQAQIQDLLLTLSDPPCSPAEVRHLDRQMQPLYAAIWAMHAETNA
ncbi:hypothetical protein CB0101_04390 [Synechococcus sp. CB0101]|uniref:hypothetical protein n=1 Tax=Synechococcus sp. CB0101 TaxID=232348 RepID=UPI00020021FB|nr:hypothetical protein [Synechococcus sp. CB0101]QCH14265.1 hypothetical protein CB0101_04390 [Synechococcus sp. CB0101]